MRDLDDVYREHVATISEHVTELRAAQTRLLEQMQGGGGSCGVLCWGDGARVAWI